MSDDVAARTRLSLAMLRPAGGGEIALVLGPPIALSLASAIVWHLRQPGPIPFTDRNVLVSLGFQVLIAACLLPYLIRRGWKPLAVAGHPEPHDIARGVGVWLGLLACFYLTLLALFIAAPNFVAPLRARSPFTGALSPPVIVAAAVLDPIFEEFLLLGYAVPALGNRFGIKVASVATSPITDPTGLPTLTVQQKSAAMQPLVRSATECIARTVSEALGLLVRRRGLAKDRLAIAFQPFE